MDKVLQNLHEEAFKQNVEKVIAPYIAELDKGLWEMVDRLNMLTGQVQMLYQINSKLEEIFSEKIAKIEQRLED